MIRMPRHRVDFQAIPIIIKTVITPVMFFLLISSAQAVDDSIIKIGVLSERGIAQCLKQWSPTAEYLTGSIQNHSFIIVPLAFSEVFEAVQNGRIDFVLVNSSLYVQLEEWFGVNRIATLKRAGPNGVYKVYGGVIITRKSNNSINGIKDLHGKTFMAVDKEAFGGWITVWRELAENGLDPRNDFKTLMFGGTNDAVVYAVRNGDVEAGSVRTDTLERMRQEGLISVSDFKVINTVVGEHKFPFALSTRLYPEWPIATLKHTDDELAKNVAAALMNMDQFSEAAIAAKCAGWTIPSNYQPVHECLKALKTGPYEYLGRITIDQMLRQYWLQTMLTISLIIILAVSTAVFYRLNIKIRAINAKLANEIDTRKKAESEKEKVIVDLKSALSEVKTLRGFLPICSNCKKIRDDAGYWRQVEQYIEDRSEAKFSHGICPDCIKRLYPDFYDEIEKKGKRG